MTGNLLIVLQLTEYCPSPNGDAAIRLFRLSISEEGPVFKEVAVSAIA
jgi:hypothetical protein